MNSHSRDSIQPFFLTSRAGQVFALYRPAATGSGPLGAILYAPPFAEEMNKARRQMALHARHMASLGYASLSIDLYGTGDSEGEFVDARWQIWLEDLVAGHAWLAAKGWERITVCGLRIGALLATDLAQHRERCPIDRLVFWQPVTSGKQFMTQFLRLRTAADMISGNDKVTTAELRALLERGLTVEVAGYELHPELVSRIDQLQLSTLPVGPYAPVDWLEVVAGAEQSLSAASNRVIEKWRELGVTVSTSTVVGEPFWTTPEIATVPALIDASARLCGVDSP